LISDLVSNELKIRNILPLYVYVNNNSINYNDFYGKAWYTGISITTLLNKAKSIFLPKISFTINRNSTNEPCCCNGNPAYKDEYELYVTVTWRGKYGGGFRGVCSMCTINCPCSKICGGLNASYDIADAVLTALTGGWAAVANLPISLTGNLSGNLCYNFNSTNFTGNLYASVVGTFFGASGSTGWQILP
jgi:hypothetical protein